MTSRSCRTGTCQMSFVIVLPDMLGTAATDLAGIGSTLNAANTAAAAQTTTGEGGSHLDGHDDVKVSYPALGVVDPHLPGHECRTRAGRPGSRRQPCRAGQRGQIGRP